MGRDGRTCEGRMGKREPSGKYWNAVVFTVLLLLAGGVDARVREGKLSIAGAQQPLKPLLRAHGLDEGAQVVLTIWDVHVDVHSRERDETPEQQIGFFLSLERKKEELQQALIAKDQCPLQSDCVLTILTLNDVNTSGGPQTVVKNITSGLSGEYTPFFHSCTSDASVSLSYKLQLYNSHNGVRDYLSSGEAPLPAVYFSSFLCFAVASAVWAYVLYSKWQQVHKIHLLMLALVIIKTMTSICEASMYNLIRWQGAPEGWNVAYYVFTFLRGVLLFTVIVLIGTGWSFVKPFLEGREKNVIGVVIPLQVLANIAIIVLDETGPSVSSWFTWRDVFHLLDIICCCAVLFPIVWSIQHLKSAAHADGKAAMTMNKLRLFRHFYIIVVCYVYFTRIVVYLVRSTVPYRYEWTAALANEAATLVFYLITAFKFMPAENNPYLHVDIEGLQAEEVELEEGDFSEDEPRGNTGIR